MRRFTFPLAAALLATSLGVASAQDDRIREVRVQFDPGASSAIVEDSITGDSIIDYKLGAAAGQYANISLAGPGTTYFNLLPPGSEGEAMFVGASAPAGNQFEGLLPESGDYTVRVYQLGNAKDTGQTTDFRLEMIIAASAGSAPEAPAPGTEPPYVAPEEGGPRQWEVTGITTTLNLRDGPTTAAQVVATVPPGAILSNLGCEQAAGRTWCDVQPVEGGPRGFASAEFLSPAKGPDGGVTTGENDSAIRAGMGDFDATGMVPCAQTRGQPMGQCDFGVARAGGGDATVVVSLPDGRSRALFFSRGEFVSADTAEADGYSETSATREGDLNMIRVGPERYEVPDAVVFGG